jgi:transposase
MSDKNDLYFCNFQNKKEYFETCEVMVEPKKIMKLKRGMFDVFHLCPTCYDLAAIVEKEAAEVEEAKYRKLRAEISKYSGSGAIMIRDEIDQFIIRNGSEYTIKELQQEIKEKLGKVVCGEVVRNRCSRFGIEYMTPGKKNYTKGLNKAKELVEA